MQMLGREGGAIGADEQDALIFFAHRFEAMQHARAEVSADLLMTGNIEVATPALHGWVREIVSNPERSTRSVCLAGVMHCR